MGYSLIGNAASVCVGQFMNPISDVCWDCAFPIKMFGQTIIHSSSGEDYNSTNFSGVNQLICVCNNIVPRTGVPVSFWQFTNQVDVTHTPYCMVGLGQMMDMGVNNTMSDSRRNTGDENAVFRQVHFYINPLLGLMGAVLDARCLSPSGFDLPYVSELDPTWYDEELGRTIQPDVYLFNNIVSQLACAADCIAATAGLGDISQLLFWCGGCNGTLYPLDGWNGSTNGAVQDSELFVHRLLAKLHRLGSQFATAGPDPEVMCGAGKIQWTMDKREYKITMVFPVPQASNTGSNGQGTSGPVLGCCEPFGRSTVLWGSGREIPFRGEDQSYGIFKKRDCCQ